MRFFEKDFKSTRRLQADTIMAASLHYKWRRLNIKKMDSFLAPVQSLMGLYKYSPLDPFFSLAHSFSNICKPATLRNLIIQTGKMPGVRNSESRGWGSLSNPFANPVEDIEGGVPFEDLPSSGSQTTTLNGRTDEHPQIKKIKDGQ